MLSSASHLRNVIRGMRCAFDAGALTTALRSTAGASRRVRSDNAAAEVDVVRYVLAARAERIETSHRRRPQLRDANDEMVLEAAVNGRAEALMTFNERDFAAVMVRFELELIGPKDLLRRMT